jgi:hypothetical protein
MELEDLNLSLEKQCAPIPKKNWETPRLDIIDLKKTNLGASPLGDAKSTSS